MLAEAKAMKLSALHPTALVIASDQLLVCDGNIYSKPVTRTDAKTRLQQLSGKTHELVTAGIILLGGQRLWHVVKSPKITCRQLDDQEIESYLDAMGDDAFITPGVYMIEKLGSSYYQQNGRMFLHHTGLPHDRMSGLFTSFRTGACKT